MLYSQIQIKQFSDLNDFICRCYGEITQILIDPDLVEGFIDKISCSQIEQNNNAH